MYYAKLKNTVSKGTYCMIHLHGFLEKVKLWDRRQISGIRGQPGAEMWGETDDEEFIQVQREKQKPTVVFSTHCVNCSARGMCMVLCEL